MNRAQQTVGTGFIGGTPGSLQLWKEIKEGNIRSESFSLNGKWVPLYNIHKTYAGLRDAYLYAGSDLARQMLIALTDWMASITSGLTEQQMQDMLRSEHGGLNEIFADVASITGNKKYLELARRFSHKTLLEPLIVGEDHLTGMHANTQIPMLGIRLHVFSGIQLSITVPSVSAATAYVSIFILRTISHPCSMIYKVRKPVTLTICSA